MINNQTPKASIVIPAFNAAPTIEKAILACLAQSYPKDKLEIIVVDDGSSDNTAEIIKRHPVKYIFQENSGPAKARNTGWKSSAGDVVCFTDADCQPEKEWVLKLVGKFTDEEIAAVAGSYGIVNSNSLKAGCIHEEIIQRHLKMPEFIRVFGSYNVAMRRDILEKLGGFEEGFPQASGEDNDLSYRILQHGFKIYFAKDVLVYHYYPQSLRAYLKGQFQHGFWRMKLYKEHPQMAVGDDYTIWKDIIEPPLALMIIFLVPFTIFRIVLPVWIACLFIYSILQLPMALKICWRTKHWMYLELFWITFLRGFSRGVGMLFGLLNIYGKGDVSICL